MNEKNDKEYKKKKIMEDILNEHYNKSEKSTQDKETECFDLEGDESVKHEIEETVFIDLEPKAKPTFGFEVRTCSHPSNSTCQQCVQRKVPVKMIESSCKHNFDNNCKNCVSSLTSQHYLKDRKKRMEALKQKAGKLKPTLLLECDLCKYTCGYKSMLQVHMKAHIQGANKKEEYQFFFKTFKGDHCQLLSRKDCNDPTLYTQAEVVYRIGPDNLPSKHLDDLFPSQTCHFFIPLATLRLHPEMNSWTNLEVSFTQFTQTRFQAYFPTFKRNVLWAADVLDAMDYVANEEMFILTKSRFYLIQNFHGKYQNDTFCKYLKENIFDNILEMEEGIDNYLKKKPQVKLTHFICPIEDCIFISDKHFVGLRSHMASQHFSDQIVQGAKPRLHGDTINEKVSSCMSNWNCSIPQLRASGDLVHHYGIYHCLVDQFFQQYGNLWILKNLGSQFLFENRCPFDGIKFEEESNLVDHLTFEHFFSLILPELENKIFFKRISIVGKRLMVFKCPFCSRKFKSPGWTDHDEIDMKEIVAHCGADHCFTLYHMISDKNILENRDIPANRDTHENRFKPGSASGSCETDNKISCFVIDKKNSEANHCVYKIKRKKANSPTELEKPEIKREPSDLIDDSLNNSADKKLRLISTTELKELIKIEVEKEDEIELKIISVQTENTDYVK